MPKIIATTLVRVVAKHEIVEQARRQDDKNNSGAVEIFGIIADIATNLSEIADVRSWNTLPTNIQIARLIVPTGNYPITLGRSNVSSTSNDPTNKSPTADSENKPNSTILNLAKGQKAVILGNSLGTQLYHYKTR